MLETLLKECQSSPLDAETAEKLNSLKSEAFAEKAYPIYLEAIQMLTNYYESNQEYDQAIALIKESLEQEVSDGFQPTVQLVDQLIGLLLKTEDFSELKKILQYRERFLADNKALKRMQQFYLAVCYEGLKQTDLAIETLQAIPDTLSSSNLVSKYLKLALLYLDKKNIAKAQEMVQYARHFDREQKNPIFLLVESDLAYQKGDVLAALEHYQSYFIAAKVKNRYLERYIRINLQLNNLEDAWSFFLEHLPKVDRLISKHARREFYQAGIDLCLAYQQMEMLLTLKDKLAGLDRPNVVSVDSYQGVEFLLKRSAGRQVSAKSRDVLLEHLRDLMDQIALKRLVFIHLHPDGIMIMTYQKGLLLEKVTPFSALKGTLIDNLLSSDQDDLIYTQEELGPIIDYLVPNNPIDALFVIAARVHQECYPQAFLIALCDDPDRFMHVHKLFRVTRQLLEMRLSDHLFQTDQSSRSRHLEKGLTLLGTGLLKIEKGVVRFLTDATKAIFGFSEDTLAFDRFQTGFVAENAVYLDTFLHREQLTLGYRHMNGSIKQLSFRIWQEDLQLVMTVKDITHAYSQTSKLTAAGLEDFLYGIKPLNLIPAEHRLFPAGQTILAFQVQGLSALFGHIAKSDTNAFGIELDRMVKKVAKQVFGDLYLADPEHFLIICTTTDKRVIERIAKDIRTQFVNLIKPEHRTTLSFAAFIVSKPIESETIKAQLIQLLYTEKKSLEAVHYLGKAELEMFALWDSIAQQMGRLIQEKRLMIDYHPVGSWQDRKIRWLEAELASDLGFHTEADFSMALERSELLGSYLEAFLQQVCHDLKKALGQSEDSPPIILRFKRAFVARTPLIEQALKILKNRRISERQVVIVLEYDPNTDQSFWEAVNRVAQSNYPMGIAKWIKDWRGSQLDDCQQFRLAFVESDELRQLPKSWFDTLKSVFPEGMIFDHGQTTLKKSLLTEMGLSYIKGAFFPPLRVMPTPSPIIAQDPVRD